MAHRLLMCIISSNLAESLEATIRNDILVHLKGGNNL